MTRKEFDELPVGQMVWLNISSVFRFPMIGIVRKPFSNHSAVYVNFFGDAQTTFDYRGIEKHVRLYDIDMTKTEGE